MVQSGSVLAWLAAAAALSAVQGSPLEDNPITPLPVVSALTDDHPAFGGPPTRAMVHPVVPPPMTMSSRPLDLTKTNETSTLSRHLEGGSSDDITRLEAHFGQKMIANLDQITKDYKASTMSPAPWPGSYWAAYRDSINAETHAGEPSPAEKYAKAFGYDVKAFMDKVSKGLGIDRYQDNRECSSDSDCTSLNDGSVCAKRKNAAKGKCLGTWWGICHAWSPAAILEPEGNCDVTKNGVTFHVNDLKALITATYDGARVPVVFTGARYDGSSNARDSHGRYIDVAERDLGPGFFLIAVANIMGRFKKSFVVDIDATAEVWNQPVQGYEIKTIKPMSPTDAAKQYFNTATYLFNTAAVKVAYVNMLFSYIEESNMDGPLVASGRVAADTKTKSYEFLVELDAQNTVIGGEWLYDSQADHPDFLWFGTRKPQSGTVTSLNLDYDKISDLLKQSVACSGSPTPTPTPNVTTAAPNATTPAPTPNVTTPVPTPNATLPNVTTPVPTPNVTLPNVTTPVPTPNVTLPNVTTPVPTPNVTTVTPAPNATVPSNATTPAPTPNVTTVAPTPAPTYADSCGNDQVGAKACPTGQYCQPWNPTSYQCRTIDAKCGKQETGIDFYGEDIATYWVYLPEQCCEQCHKTPDCQAYTFINYNPDGYAYCYLKKGTGVRQSRVGAVSAKIIRSGASENGTVTPNVTTPAPTPNVTTVTPTPTPNVTTATPTSTPNVTVAPTVRPDPNVTVAPHPNATTPAPTTVSPTPTPAPTYADSCGNDQDGAKACPNGQYCQPWNPTSYQCRTIDAKCGKQETGVDFYGEDIATYWVYLPEQCCEQCHKTPDCQAYTFVNYNPDGYAYCYLKKGTGTRKTKVGAVSAKIVRANGGSSTVSNANSAAHSNAGSHAGSAATTCENQEWGACGNAYMGAQCCSSGTYCQPWDRLNFQCVPKPDKCSKIYPQSDFGGDNLKTIFGLNPWDCCEECSKTSGCKGYTFVNDNFGTPACYLKKSIGSRKAHKTAVSGVVG